MLQILWWCCAILLCTVVFNTLWIVCITKVFDLYRYRHTLSTNEICCCPSIRDICIYALMNTRRGFRLYSFSENIKEIKDYIIVSNTLKLSFPVIVLFCHTFVLCLDHQLLHLHICCKKEFLHNLLLYMFMSDAMFTGTWKYYRMSMYKEQWVWYNKELSWLIVIGKYN